ncbi:MAG: PilZ domain-containing protein [Planctomycetota bacterium]|jgi:hypothetical protein
MNGFEKRKHRRLEIELNLLCSRPGEAKPKIQTGTVINIAPGGLYFKTDESRFEPGNLAEVSIEIAPQPGRLEFGGTMKAKATVVRTEIVPAPRSGRREPPLQGVALQFHARPRLSQ